MLLDTETLLADLPRTISERACRNVALTSALDLLHARLDQILRVVTPMTARDCERKLETRAQDNWLVDAPVSASARSASAAILCSPVVAGWTAVQRDAVTLHRSLRTCLKGHVP